MKILQNLFNKKLTMKRKGFTLIEVMVVLVIIIGLGIAAFLNFQPAQGMGRTAKMYNEMDALANACVAYQAISLAQTPPAKLSDLATGLTAEKSIDGQKHDSFVNTSNANNVDGKYLDPWGVEYVYDVTTRTITCTPKNDAGESLPPVVKGF